MLNREQSGQQHIDSLQAVLECKKRAHIQRKLHYQTLTEAASDLASVVTQKQALLISTAGEKGVSSWLTADPVTSNGTILNKSDFRDAVCLRYSFEMDGIPDR